LDRRVGVPIQAGAPELWKWLKTKIRQWFREHIPTDSVR